VTDIDPSPYHLLITVTGRDRPGVTAAILGALHQSATTPEIVDVEQVVIGDRLLLGILVTDIGDSGPIERSARLCGDALGLSTEVETVTDSLHLRRRDRGQLHVTILGAPLHPTGLGALTSAIADAGGNVDRIVRLSAYPVTAIDLEVSGAIEAELRSALAAEAATQRLDVAVQRAGLLRRAQRLIVMDVDSTLIQGEVVELIAEHAGCGDQVRRITDAAMRGELDFEQSLRARVSLFAGTDAQVLEVVARQVRFTPGARTLVRTLKRLDYRFAIVSGGFSQITDRLAVELGIDYATANTLEVVEGKLTGQLTGPIVDRAGKATALRAFAVSAGVPLGQTVAVGDGANDLDMLACAGLGIAFNAKPVVRDAADTSVSVPYLDSLLFLLGISREEIEAADAADL
jgi:phosphoserine phosphatase